MLTTETPSKLIIAIAKLHFANDAYTLLTCATPSVAIGDPQ